MTSISPSEQQVVDVRTVSVPSVIVRSPVKDGLLVSTSSPAPIFSSGRAPPVSEITPDWVALPVSTCSCVVLELSVIGVAMVTPLA